MSPNEPHPDKPDNPAPAWHALEADEVFQALDCEGSGLDLDSVRQRLARHGPNRLPAGKPRPAWKRLLAQFHNVLIYALAAAAAMAALLDHLVDAAVIAAVVLVNALIGFLQEGRAERAMEAIGQMLALKARVRRDGKRQTIPAEDLVPGDLVELRAGDKVPADVRIIESHDLRIDQAALTGESLAVSKSAVPVPVDTDLAERHCMAYSGSMVSSGQALGVVAVTGTGTELGRISAMLDEVDPLVTPLIRQINRFGWILTVIIFVLAGLVVGLGALIHSLPLADGFLAGVALVVAAIPEGLPAIITITLAVGIQRMAGRNAVIRRLPAVETLGAVTVICSDKTGTLTRNELAAERILLADGELGVAGVDALNHPDCTPLLEAASLASDAEPGSNEGEPIERALVGLATTFGIEVDSLRRSNPRKSLLPFSSDRKFMASLHPDRLCVKGAPEKVLDRCRHQLSNGKTVALERDRWHAALESMAAQGLRLLAVASRPVPADANTSAGDDRKRDLDALANELTLLGIVAFADPLREGVIDVVAACRRAGIQVKMITGDHAATARSIGSKLGLDDGTAVVGGAELDQMDEAALAARADAVHIYARTTPEHKLRLVKALQGNGHVVAMTGDGANDAPALKRADIGVAMGIKGTEASRQAADMVLSDDNFVTIVAGVEEGRCVYDNIRKALMFILPTNGAEALVVVLAVLAGLTLPLTPVQILWVNMVTAITLALALAFEPLEHNAMRKAPRRPEEGLITRFMLWRIVWVSIVLVIAVFWLFDQVMVSSGNEALARTVALNALVAGELVYLFNCRRWLSPSWTAEALFSNRWAWVSAAALVVLQLVLTYWSPLQAVFGTDALSATDWLPIIAVALVLFVLVEIEKALVSSRSKGRAGAQSGLNDHSG